MKCPNCGGTGVIHFRNIHVLCGKCQGIGFIDEPKPEKQMTKQEYIQTCTTEQLAETIHRLIDGGLCGLCRWDCRERCVVHKEEDEIKVIMEWLKQPHTFK